jgi:peptide/nickel transport system substrate-binding protein
MTKELEYLATQVIKGRLDRRQFMGRAGALGLTTVLASSLITSAAHAQGPVKGGTIRVGVDGGSTTDSLDPALSTNNTMGLISFLWGERLVNLTSEGDLEYVLAEEISSSPDAKTWTFKIRKGVNFSNGKSLEAEDVLATLERHAGEDSKSGALGILKDIASMRAESGTVIVELKNPNADFPYLMTDFHLLIQPNGGKDNPAAAIGTGPYILKDVEPGVRVSAEKNPNYWNEYGYAETVEIIVLNDDTARTSALQSGQVHMITRVPPKVAGLMSKVPGIKISKRSGPGHYVFIMHCDTAPFDNNDLRMALKYAINRQEMVDKILFGYGSVGNDTCINSSYPLFTEVEQREYDPEKAAFHFKASGHDGAVLLRTSDNSFPSAPDAAQLFQQSAAAAGIQLEIKREPNDGYWSDVWNKKPFCTSYWAGRPVQDQMLSTAYLSTADWNDTRFKNEKFDQLIIAARGELNQDKRRVMYADANSILQNEGGLISPMFNDFVSGISDKIGGYKETKGFDLMDLLATSRTWITA